LKRGYQVMTILTKTNNLIMEKRLKNIQTFEQMNLNENEKLSSWELSDRISNIIDSNIKEIPFEGTDVDKQGIRDSILELIYELCPEYKPKQDNEDSSFWGKDIW